MLVDFPVSSELRFELPAGSGREARMFVGVDFYGDGVGVVLYDRSDEPQPGGELEYGQVDQGGKDCQGEQKVSETVQIIYPLGAVQK